MSQDTYSSKTLGKLTQFRSITLVAVGSNEQIGTSSPAETIQSAIAKLSEKGQVIRARSEIYRTPAFPPGSGPDFANAVFAIEDAGDPHEILNVLHDIEAEFGRSREVRWGQRTLDLDLIAIGGKVVPNAATVQSWIDLPLDAQTQKVPDQLLLPHPRLQDRAFVLVPLMDIAPDWVHPLTGQTVRQMHDALPKADRDSVNPLVNSAKRP